MARPPRAGRERGPAPMNVATSRDDLGLATRGAHDLDGPAARRQVDRIAAAATGDRHRRGGRRVDETEADAVDKDQRNWLGSDAVPFAVRMRCAWTVSPAAYEVFSKLKPRTKPAAWEIVACAWVLFPRSVAVTWNV